MPCPMGVGMFSRGVTESTMNNSRSSRSHAIINLQVNLVEIIQQNQEQYKIKKISNT